MTKWTKLLGNMFTSGGTNTQLIKHSMDATPAKSSDHTNMQSKCVAGTRRVQNGILIWLDATIDEVNDQHCCNNIRFLRCIFNDVNTFTNSQQCIDFLYQIANEKAFMIISGMLGQSIVPKIHHLHQVDSIYIFCMDELAHERWAKDWYKIKGVFTEMSSMCEVLQQAVREYERRCIPLSFVLTNSNIPNQSQVSFMYTQLLKEILLSIQFKQKHFQEFILYCQKSPFNNEFDLRMIDKFKRKYDKTAAIKWYTRECFLYRMLNRALRQMEIDTIVQMGFFIRDLHEQIAGLHSRQFVNHHTMKPFVVYRGQLLSTNEFQQMCQAGGGLLSFNSFLSTSKDREISLKFARATSENPDLINVLFVMTVDPSISSTPLASISDISYDRTENEVLFSMHTVFRIDNIKQLIEDNRLWEVELNQIRDNDKDICALTRRIQDETHGYTGWDCLGRLFIKLGQSDQAQQLYEALFKTVSNDYDKANYYNQLGRTNDNQGQHEEAISFYKKALAIIDTIYPRDNVNLTATYNNIGIAYSRLGDYSNARLFLEKALELRQKICHGGHYELANSYNNLGLVYKETHDFPQALLCLEKALVIRNKPPLNHPDLAESYNNLGLLYEQMGENEKACLSYKKALEIRERSLASDNPDSARSRERFRLVSLQTGTQSKLISTSKDIIADGKIRLN